MKYKKIIFDYLGDKIISSIVLLPEDESVKKYTTINVIFDKQKKCVTKSVIDYHNRGEENKNIFKKEDVILVQFVPIANNVVVKIYSHQSYSLEKLSCHLFNNNKEKKMNKYYHADKSVLLNYKIGKNCTIHAFVWIGNNVIIGNNVKIQAYSFIPEGVKIEDDVFIGPRVTFTNDKHPPSNGKDWKKTLVKKGAVIGAGAVILPGVTIGHKAIVGAGAIVTKDVECGKTVVGNPAKTIFKKKSCVLCRSDKECSWCN